MRRRKSKRKEPKRSAKSHKGISLRFFAQTFASFASYCLLLNSKARSSHQFASLTIRFGNYLGFVQRQQLAVAHHGPAVDDRRANIRSLRRINQRRDDV